MAQSLTIQNDASRKSCLCQFSGAENISKKKFLFWSDLLIQKHLVLTTWVRQHKHYHRQMVKSKAVKPTKLVKAKVCKPPLQRSTHSVPCSPTTRSKTATLKNGVDDQLVSPISSVTTISAVSSSPAWTNSGSQSNHPAEQLETEAVIDVSHYTGFQKGPVNRSDQRNMELDIEATTNVHPDYHYINLAFLHLRQKECEMAARMDDFKHIELLLQYSKTAEQKVTSCRHIDIHL